MLESCPWVAAQHMETPLAQCDSSVDTPTSCITYLPMRGTAWEVSGTFWAMRKRKTVWARRTLMETVHFCPPAAKEEGRQRLARGSGMGSTIV